MENNTSTLLFNHENTNRTQELYFLDNFKMEEAQDIRNVLTRLSKMEISPDKELVNKVIELSRNLSDPLQ